MARRTDAEGVVRFAIPRRVTRGRGGGHRRHHGVADIRYAAVLGLVRSPEKFFDVGGLWIAIMQGDPLPVRSYNHVAFKVSLEQLAKAKLAIIALGLDLRSSRPRVSGEGQSLYFYDYDNHLLELHTGTLDERLTSYRDRKSVV